MSLPCLGATYYVRTDGNNSNDGLSNTAGGAWLTVQKAANTMAAGDSVIVGIGTFPETVETKASGTLSNPITFIGSGATVLYGFGLYHDWNYLDNFTFTTGALVYASIPFTASSIRVTRNTVKDLHTAAVRMVNSSGTQPPVANWPTNVYIAANVFTNIDTVTRVMAFYGNQSIIESNRWDGCASDAIDLWGDNNIVRANVVTNNLRDTIGLGLGSENHNDFIQTWRASTDFHSTNNLVDRNLVINSWLQLCNLEDDEYTNDFHHWTFRNNVFVNDLLNGNVGIPFCEFYNNTYYHAPYSSGSYTPIILFNQANFHGWGAKITNNAFINCGYSNNTDGLKLGWYFAAAGATPAADYNYVAGLIEFGFPTATGFTEAHGVNGGNPVFVNVDAGDARLTTLSPAVGVGANLSALFTTDMAGTTRGTAWDIGAYAYTNTTKARVKTAHAGGIKGK